MNPLNVAFFYESMEVFLSKDYKPSKLTQIIPYYIIRDSGDVYAMLTVNNSKCVSDFSSNWGKFQTLQSYVADSIKSVSLNSIKIDENYVISNSFIGYATSYNVSEGKNNLADNEIPAIFVKFNVDTIDVLNDILIKFKNNYSKIIKRVINGPSNISNIIYMPAEDLFYISRFTTYTVNTDHGNIKIDIEEDGFPALPVITDIYSPILENGDFQCSDKYNELGNCCPSINFYNNRSILLRKALLPLFTENFPILDSSI